MKSENTKLSDSDVNPKSTPSLSHSDLIGVSRSNKFAALSNLDYRVKFENDNIGVDYRVKPDSDSLCAGRSMVEMLGVLAIIGVLSVGAIAGYSKAMLKYKLNQHAQAVNILINNVFSIQDKLPRNATGITDYATLLNKLNLLPDGIIQANNNYLLLDKHFNNSIRVFYEAGNPGMAGILFWIGNAGSDYTLEACYNILKVAKENAANLYFVRTYKIYPDDSEHLSANLYTFYGDGYCTENRICLRNLNINKLEQACQSCNGGECSVGILWK